MKPLNYVTKPPNYAVQPLNYLAQPFYKQKKQEKNRAHHSFPLALFIIKTTQPIIQSLAYALRFLASMESAILHRL